MAEYKRLLERIVEGRRLPRIAHVRAGAGSSARESARPTDFLTAASPCGVRVGVAAAPPLSGPFGTGVSFLGAGPGVPSAEESGSWHSLERV